MANGNQQFTSVSAAAIPSKGTSTSPPRQVGRRGDQLSKETLDFRFSLAVQKNLDAGKTGGEDPLISIMRAGRWAFGLVLQESCSDDTRGALMEAVRGVLQTRLVEHGLTVQEVPRFLNQAEDDAIQYSSRNGGGGRQHATGPVRAFVDVPPHEEEEATPTKVEAPTPATAPPPSTTDDAPQGAPPEEETGLLVKVDSWVAGEGRLTLAEVRGVLSYYRHEEKHGVVSALELLEGSLTGTPSPAKQKGKKKGGKGNRKPEAAAATPTKVEAPTTATAPPLPSAADDASQDAPPEEDKPPADTHVDDEVAALAAESPQGSEPSIDDGSTGSLPPPETPSSEATAMAVMRLASQQRILPHVVAFEKEAEQLLEEILSADVCPSDIKEALAVILVDFVDEQQERLRLLAEHLVNRFDESQPPKEVAA